MALIQVNYLSMALFRTVPVNVILPVDKFNFDGTPAPDARPYKTLYLLHGLLGNYTDWVTGTRIQRWAEERNLAVVMPSGDNAFYIDRPAAKNCYGEFVGRELVEMTRRMFPLSDRREDTFIAGLSMGGYGAIRNGLKYSDTFGCVAGLSSALHMFDENDDPPIMDYDALGMGPLEKTRDSDMNPRVLIERLEKSKKPLPKIYLVPGRRLRSDLLRGPRRPRMGFLGRPDPPRAGLAAAEGRRPGREQRERGPGRAVNLRKKAAIHFGWPLFRALRDHSSYFVSHWLNRP